MAASSGTDVRLSSPVVLVAGTRVRDLSQGTPGILALPRHPVGTRWGQTVVTTREDRGWIDGATEWRPAATPRSEGGPTPMHPPAATRASRAGREASR